MAPIVIDANVGLALILPLAYSDPAASHMQTWLNRGEALAAPMLWGYEIASALRRSQLMGHLDAAYLGRSLEQLWALGVEQIPPSLELHRRALEWAERLDQPTAYDAQYLAVAGALQASFWTADRRLVDRARKSGVSWVHWIGEGSS